MSQWQVTATFKGGGKTTFGLEASDESAASAAAREHLKRFPKPVASVNVEPAK